MSNFNQTINYLLLGVSIFSVVIIVVGLMLNKYQNNLIKSKNTSTKFNLTKFNKVLNFINSRLLFKDVKKDIEEILEFSLFTNVEIITSIIAILLLFLNIVLIVFSINLTHLWYSKLIAVIFSIFAPYYFLSLVIYMQKEHINRQIPQLIDEFRSAFIEQPKIKEALILCSLNINKSIGRAILKVTNSAFMDKGLIDLRNRFNNIWFNIFVSLIINYKENGGELTKQLFKLNNSMTRYNNIEKKKSKRLITYEIFAIIACIVVVPTSDFLSVNFTGNTLNGSVNSEYDVLISGLVLSSAFALVVLRALRKT